MIDETASAPTEVAALPIPPPSRTAAWEGALPEQITKSVETVLLSQAESAIDRVISAVERWYSAHFHAAALAGVAPISADDKAALIQHVTEAVAPSATKEQAP